jgi:uncharacterized protein YhaN
MQIQSLSLTDFGTWKNLSLGNLSGSLNVLHGPNEVGKTTLLRFLRGMFYGQELFRSEVPLTNPSGKSRSVGIIDVETPSGKYRVERTFRLPGKFGEQALDHVVVELLQAEGAAQEATSQGMTALQVLLSGVDANIYRNVFAFGIDEIERLAALSETEAAGYLYDLSAGVDRVSLASVFRSLRGEREGLLGTADGASEIAGLLEEKASLEKQLDTISEELGRYRPLLVERARLEGKIENLSESSVEEQFRLRIADLATTVRPVWKKMQEAIAARRAMGVVPDVASEDLQRLEQLAAKQHELRLRSDALKRRAEATKCELEELPVREAFIAQGAQIEAMVSQRDWLESRVEQMDGYQDAENPQEEERQAKAQSLELGAQIQAAIPRLRPAARALKDARAKRCSAELVAKQTPASTEVAHAEGLAEELAAIDELCSDLRRRIHLEQRLLQLSDTKREFDLLQEGLVEQKVLSPRVLMLSGGLFAFGVMLACSGIFLLSMTTWSGALLTLIGIAGSVAGGWLKRLLERAQQREWDARQRQAELLALQQKEAEEECRELDELFSNAHGPFAVQLRELEKQKVALEQKVSRHEVTRAAASEAEAVAHAVEAAKSVYQEARRMWHRALHTEGLPAQLSPAAVRRLAARCREETEVANRGAVLRAEAERQEQELIQVVARVDSLCEAAGFIAEVDQNLSMGWNLLARMDAIASAWEEQQQWIAKRKTLRGQRWGLARRQRRCLRYLSLLGAQQTQDYEDLGLPVDEDLEELAQRCAEAGRYEADIASLESELIAACSETCEAEQLWKELDGVTEQQLNGERERLAKQRTKTDEKLRQLCEQRGRLGEQLLTLASDRRDAYVQLELARTEERLKRAISRWHDLVCTSQLLESIRRCYEQQRQPAALQEASLYLERITEGRYRRVWTRLDQEMLCVEDCRGQHLPVLALSRGTREPLMLALRLALVSQFARRGIRLPIVLDEVLVHFDAQRARAAAEVLKDFAAAGGHQIFLFTCHKHLVSLFTEIGAEVRLLPDTPQQGKGKSTTDHSRAA